MTKVEREQIGALLALLRATLRNSTSTREALALLEAVKFGRVTTLAALTAQLRTETPKPGPVVDDCPLACSNVTPELCVTRQEENEKRGRRFGYSWMGDEDDATVKKRGKSYRYPNCVTRLCSVGARVRAASGEGK